MTGAAYQVRVENIFEGPMDLLVHLIKKNDVDIYDIPIALITDQFLEYINWMQEMEIDVAADFLVMASTLAQIKSRLLLPDTSGDREDQEDPRDLIAGPLAEYMFIREAAGLLDKRNMLDRDIFTRSLDPRQQTPRQGESRVEADLYDLIAVYQELAEKMSAEPGYEITPEKISVREKMTEIIEILEKNKSVSFRDLAVKCSDRAEIIASFLAVLEVVKLNLAGISRAQSTDGLTLYSR